LVSLRSNPKIEGRLYRLEIATAYMNILFWNTKKQDVRNLVCDAAKLLSIDVVAIIESGVSPTRMLSALKSKASPYYYIPRAIEGRVQLFCRDVKLNLNEIYSGNRISIRKALSGGTELSLGFVHLVDKENFDPMNQLTQARLLVEEIKSTENKQGHTRTILIGDFNMNPFDQVMNVAGGMNALMAEGCVRAGSRKVQSVKYEYFYNPMWNLLGDRTPGPPGTFYHSNSGKGHFGWNMLDQVLLRPSIIPWFDDVRILTKIGNSPLDTKMGRPNKSAVSDHFPLLVTLK